MICVQAACGYALETASKQRQQRKKLLSASHYSVPVGAGPNVVGAHIPALHDMSYSRNFVAGPVSAVISEERGSLTIDESIGIALSALADHSLTVRKTALQEIRNILHQHRAWLSGLLPATNATVSSKGSSQQTALLCRLLGALLKCCDPEVRLDQSQSKGVCLLTDKFWMLRCVSGYSLVTLQSYIPDDNITAAESTVAFRTMFPT